MGVGGEVSGTSIEKGKGNKRIETGGGRVFGFPFKREKEKEGRKGKGEGGPARDSPLSGDVGYVNPGGGEGERKVKGGNVKQKKKRKG